MPRPNKERSIGIEGALSARIAEERKRRGWTYERLAEEMTAVGCSIQPSAIFKVERAARRITVDELAAYSIVWAIPMDRLIDVEPGRRDRP
jgi:transcriptional regulator with XRE-family HTH domain